MAIGARVRGMLENYNYVTPEILAYFDKRPEQATRDSNFALAYVREHYGEQLVLFGNLEASDIENLTTPQM